MKFNHETVWQKKASTDRPNTDLSSSIYLCVQENESWDLGRRFTSYTPDSAGLTPEAERWHQAQFSLCTIACRIESQKKVLEVVWFLPWIRIWSRIFSFLEILDPDSDPVKSRLIAPREVLWFQPWVRIKSQIFCL